MTATSIDRIVRWEGTRRDGLTSIRGTGRGGRRHTSFSLHVRQRRVAAVADQPSRPFPTDLCVDNPGNWRPPLEDSANTSRRISGPRSKRERRRRVVTRGSIRDRPTRARLIIHRADAILVIKRPSVRDECRVTNRHDRRRRDTAYLRRASVTGDVLEDDQSCSVSRPGTACFISRVLRLRAVVLRLWAVVLSQDCEFARVRITTVG